MPGVLDTGGWSGVGWGGVGWGGESGRDEEGRWMQIRMKLWVSWHFEIAYWDIW